MSETFLFQAIQFNQTIQFSVRSIQPIDKALSGATTPGQSGPGSNGNEGVFRIPQSPSITGTLPSDCLVSYRGHSFGRGLTPCRGTVGVFYSPSRLGTPTKKNKGVWSNVRKNDDDEVRNERYPPPENKEKRMNENLKFKSITSK